MVVVGKRTVRRAALFLLVCAAARAVSAVSDGENFDQ
jgi:hypothetical protein